MWAALQAFFDDAMAVARSRTSAKETEGIQRAFNQHWGRIPELDAESGTGYLESYRDNRMHLVTCMIIDDVAHLRAEASRSAVRAQQRACD